MFQQIFNQVLLPRLPEYHPVDDQGSAERHQLELIATELERGNMSFHSCTALYRKIPIWNHSPAKFSVIVHGSGEHGFPRVTATVSPDDAGVNLGDIFPDGVPLVPVYPAFSLLHVHRIIGEIPMNNGMAVWVKIESFLTY